MESSHRIANLPHAAQLVKHFPDEAIDLIAQTCELQDIMAYVTWACQKYGRNPYEPWSPKPESKKCELLLHTSSTDSQQSVSPPSVHRYPHPPLQPSRPAFPPSPATTASSSKSAPSKSRIEYIIIVTDGPEDNPVLEHKLSKRNASVKFSVISRAVARTRLFDGVNIEEIPQGNISLQHPGVPSGVLLSSEQVTLTWRRPLSHKTHETLFYLVSDEIDADVLLGYTDLGEDTYPTEIYSPHPKRPSQITTMYTPAPEVPQNRQATPSRHPSSFMYGSNGTTPVHEIIQPFFGRARSSRAAASAGYGDGQQHSPTPTQIHRPGTSSSVDPHFSHQTSTATPTPLTSSHQQSPHPDEIDVECKWDMASKIISIDLNATGEHMFNIIERIFRRQFKKKLDLSAHFIRFTPGEQAEDTAERVLDLDKATLTKDWYPTVKWIRENRTTNSPHLFAFVELDEG